MGAPGVGLFAGNEILSVPRGANGFGLPSFPSGVSVMLESRKLSNALSVKIASSNLMFLTLKSRVRKSWGIEGFASLATTADALGFEGEEIKVAVSGSFFIKKT